MMTKEEYKKEIVRMWDSLRDEHKGEYSCFGVNCEFCPLGRRCDRIFSFEMIEAVERLAKEHQPKKFKVSKLEYDILLTAIDFSAEEETFNDIDILYGLLKKGYFNGSTTSMSIREYLKSCEVKENV